MKDKVRYVSADLLRGLVMIIMIEVHVFNAFLQPGLKLTGWFGILNFINGLVAPSFLFVSGFAFQVSSGSKLDEMRKLGKAFWKKTRRILQIIIIGYALHLPFYSLSKIIREATPQLIQSFYAVDILQCIGFGLMFLFITRLLIKSDKFYHYFLIVVLILVMIISPFIWQIDFNRYLPPAIASYFNNLHGSLFPIFPWINFLLAGAIFAKYFVDASAKNEEVKFIKQSATFGIVLLLFGHFFFSELLPESIQLMRPHPVFFLERVGYVLFLFMLCWYWDKKSIAKKTIILDASRESLLVYWLHLIIIFGMFWNEKSLAMIIGNNLNVLETSAVTLILITLMIVAAKLWGWAKENHPQLSTVLLRLAVIILVIIFISV